MKRARGLATIGLVLACASVLAGCGGEAKGAGQQTVAWKDLTYAMPPQVSGYDVKEEKDGAKGLKSGGAESLLDGGTLFSFRKQTRLFATLEIGEIRPAANAGDSEFQQNVVAQIGTSIMRATQVKKQTVYEGTGNRQLVFVWFKKRLMHVLLTHDVKDPTPIVEALLDLQ